MIKLALVTCKCVVKNRIEGEPEREWLKRWMCMYHWMQTDYYRRKFDEDSDSEGL